LGVVTNALSTQAKQANGKARVCVKILLVAEGTTGRPIYNSASHFTTNTFVLRNKNVISEDYEKVKT
jgi:hypothetical protein